MGRVLVLGGEGMLGHMVVHVLSRSGRLAIAHTSRSGGSGYSYDVEHGPDGLRHILDAHGPFDYMINCIGILGAGIHPLNPASMRRAIQVNALFPHELAMVAQEAGVRVIHISTDGVFSGASEGPYFEDAPHDCPDIYGKTKSLGEVHAPGVLNLRCSIIGPDPRGGKGLIEWFLAQPDAGVVEGYTDYAWNGVTTLQFAELCRRIVLKRAFDRIRDESPIHHFCPNCPLSKYEMLQIFEREFRRTVRVTPVRSPRGPTRRILATRFRCLRELFGDELDFTQAVRDLSVLSGPGVRVAVEVPR